MNYAMILNGLVIGVLQNQDEEPFWGPDQEGNSVRAVTCGSSVKLGMVYKDGKFFENIPSDPNIQELTGIQQLMQSLSSEVIRGIIAQEERRLLAQQLADIELILLGGNT
ncbi:hypothetical protein SDC9_203733 [bioreactor metagenome]|uniref:Uncharacterized protein n=1 Tax=bioreactor metagenome TaxID=1076179 RepID=A0A645IY24_9ZZZZ|nr:hypothetical protein [Anaerotignum propionicum]MEA5057147.1 hypothetical protein [Anaerotignum propionicum]